LTVHRKLKAKGKTGIETSAASTQCQLSVVSGQLSAACFSPLLVRAHRLTLCSMRSEVHDRIIGPDFHPVCDASHLQASGHLPQPLSTGGEETAEQSTCAEFLQPGPPTFGITHALEPALEDRPTNLAFPSRLGAPTAIPKSDSSLQTPRASHIKAQGRAAHPGSVTIGSPTYQSVESDRRRVISCFVRAVHALPVCPVKIALPGVFWFKPDIDDGP
jgi:hypothetical protein